MMLKMGHPMYQTLEVTMQTKSSSQFIFMDCMSATHAVHVSNPSLDVGTELLRKESKSNFKFFEPKIKDGAFDASMICPKDFLYAFIQEK